MCLQGREMCMAAAQHKHGVVEWLADLVLSVRRMLLGDQERRYRDAITRARLRRDDAVRGRARDFQERILTSLLAVLGPWGVVKVMV